MDPELSVTRNIEFSVVPWLSSGSPCILRPYCLVVHATRETMGGKEVIVIRRTNYN